MNFNAYIDIAQRIKDLVPAVKHVDLFNEQYNNPEKEIPFTTPAVFVEFAPTPWSGTTNGVQEGTGAIRIHIVFDFFGSSHNVTSLNPTQQQQLFTHYNVSKQVHRILEGYQPSNCTQLRRVLSSPDHNHDQLLIEVMEYACMEYDNSADVFQDFVDSPINDITFNEELTYSTLEEYLNSSEAAFIVHAINHSNKEQQIKDALCGVFTNAQVKVNGNNFATAASGDVVDVPVVNEGGTFVGNIVSGQVVVPDAIENTKNTLGETLHTTNINAGASHDTIVQDAIVNIKNSANATIQTVNAPAEKTINSTMPDKALTINGTAFDALVVGTDKNVAVKDGGGTPVGSKVGSEWIVEAPARQLTLNFAVGAFDTSVVKIDYAGVISATTDTNVATKVWRLNGTVVSLPFTVAINDILELTITRTSSVAVSSVQITKGTYSAVTGSQAIPDMGGDGRYMYVLNYIDQTVTCVDLSTHTNIATITLVAARYYSSLAFRHIDKYVYVFGTRRVCKICADPSSGNFNNVYSLAGVINTDTAMVNAFVQGKTVSYNPDTDRFNICTANLYWVWNPNTNTDDGGHGSNILRGYSSTHFLGLGSMVGDNSQASLMRDLTGANNIAVLEGTANMSHRRYKNRMIASGNQVLLIMDINTMRVITSISNSIFRQSGLVVVGDTAIGCSVFSTSYSRINLLTNTTIDTQAPTVQAGQTLNGHMIYSPYSGRVYMAAGQGSNVAGVNRIHMINPAAAANASYLGFITVGNLVKADCHQNIMCLNRLQYE